MTAFQELFINELKIVIDIEKNLNKFVEAINGNPANNTTTTELVNKEFPGSKSVIIKDMISKLKK